MVAGAGKPALRFAGFDGDWEQRKLGEECQIIMGQSPDGSTYSDIPSDFILVQGNADLKDGWVFPRVWTTKKTKVANPGDLIMSVRAPAGAMGKTAYTVVLGRGVAAIKGNEFIYQALIKMNESGYWKKLASGSTFESISSDIISNADILVPQDINEQIQIGSFFQDLDNLITLHQRKLEKLKNIKTSFLEKMFPAEGKTVPALRFAGFEGDWKQHKLGDMCTEFKSGDFIQAEKIDTSGDYPVYGGNGLRGYTNRYNHDGEFALIGRQGALCGNMNYFIGKAYFTEHAIAVKANKNHETRFLFYCFGNMNLGQYSGQSAQPGLAVGKLIESQTKVPEKVEQKYISSFLNNLDNLITLHQRKLEKLKNIKTSLLEKMFA